MGPQLDLLLLREATEDLSLDLREGAQALEHGGPTLVGEHHPLGSTVGGVRLSRHDPEALELIHVLAHRLLRDLGSPHELRLPGAVKIDVREEREMTELDFGMTAGAEAAERGLVEETRAAYKEMPRVVLGFGKLRPKVRSVFHALAPTGTGPTPNARSSSAARRARAPTSTMAPWASTIRLT